LYTINTEIPGITHNKEAKYNVHRAARYTVQLNGQEHYTSTTVHMYDTEAR